MKQQRTHYGIDAPVVPISYGLTGCVVLVLALIVLNGGQKEGYWLLLYAAVLLAGTGIYLHATLRGKFLIWEHVLAGLKIPPHAKVLDLGCGHGAVLIMAAKRLGDNGRAVGVDLWRKIDQSGNDLHAAERNAEIEGVADKIKFITADMSSLPLKNASFDFVFSNLAIHNIKNREARRQALREAVRVLKPGGTLIIADISKTKEYMQVLQSASVKKLTCRNAGWPGWWTGPWMATYIISATKA